jgi:HNH endonuclease
METIRRGFLRGLIVDTVWDIAKMSNDREATEESVNYLLEKKSKKPLRIRLAKNSNWKCYWCDQDLCEQLGYQNTATTEHVVPRSKGGENNKSNRVSACHRCNWTRRDMDSEEFKELASTFQPDSRPVEDGRVEYITATRGLAPSGNPRTKSPGEYRRRADGRLAKKAYITGNIGILKGNERANRFYMKIVESGGIKSADMHVKFLKESKQPCTV